MSDISLSFALAPTCHLSTLALSSILFWRLLLGQLYFSSDRSSYFNTCIYEPLSVNFCFFHRSITNWSSHCHQGAIIIIIIIINPSSSSSRHCCWFDHIQSSSNPNPLFRATELTTRKLLHKTIFNIALYTIALNCFALYRIALNSKELILHKTIFNIALYKNAFHRSAMHRIAQDHLGIGSYSIGNGIGSNS